MEPTSQSSPPLRSIIKQIFISLDEPRLRAGWRLLIQLVLLFIFLILASIPVMVLGTYISLPRTVSALLEQLISLFVFILSIYLTRRFIDRRSFVSLGLRLDRWVIYDILAGIGITALMMALIFVIEWTFGWMDFRGFAWKTTPPDQILISTGSMIIVFILVGWNEELFSRGYQLQNMEDGLNTFWAVLISSSLFGLLHLGNPNATWISAGGILLAGVFLASAYLRTRLLWLSIGLHIGWNFFEGPVFGFPVSGMNFDGWILQTATGPELITGGPFGPEAGLVLLPALLLGFTLIFVYTRGRDTSAVQNTAVKDTANGSDS